MTARGRQRGRHSGGARCQPSVGQSFSPCARGRAHAVACPVHSRSLRRGIHALALVRRRLADGGAGLHRRHAAGHAHHHLPHHGCGVLRTQLAALRALAAGASAVRPAAAPVARRGSHQPQGAAHGLCRHGGRLCHLLDRGAAVLAAGAGRGSFLCAGCGLRGHAAAAKAGARARRRGLTDRAAGDFLIFLHIS